MNSYHYNGIAFSSGDRIKVVGLSNDKAIAGKTGTIIKVGSGGLKVRFGNAADGHSVEYLHPSVLVKVV